jgi:hypothetical protein
MNHITYPPSYFEPPDNPLEDDVADWIKDDDARLVAAITEVYNAESLAYRLIGIWHHLGSMDARGELAQGVLDDVHDIVKDAINAEIKRIASDRADARVEREWARREDSLT